MLGEDTNRIVPDLVHFDDLIPEHDVIGLCVDVEWEAIWVDANFVDIPDRPNVSRKRKRVTKRNASLRRTKLIRYIKSRTLARRVCNACATSFPPCLCHRLLSCTL